MHVDIFYYEYFNFIYFSESLLRIFTLRHDKLWTEKLKKYIYIYSHIASIVVIFYTTSFKNKSTRSKGFIGFYFL